MKTFHGLFAALAAVALVLAACGGGADRTKAQLRLVNASGYQQLDLRVDGQLRQGQVGYGQTAGYVEADPDDDDVSLNRPGSATALLSFNAGLSAKKYYTVLAFGAQGALRQVLLDENTSAPDNNRTQLRVLNAASDAGAVDVYITGADEPLASAVPVQAAAAVGTVNGWLTQTSGSLRLRVTAAGNKADLRLDQSGFALGNRQVATLVLTPTSGGVLVNALLVVQQSGIAPYDNTQSRVRVVHGLVAGSQVTLKIGDTTLLNNVASPAATLYTLVPAGSLPLVLTVNGTAQPATTTVLAAGGDYTLLAHGSASAPLSAVVEDDNRPPTDSTQARIRLINGVSGLSSPLSMTLDFAPIGSNVLAGAASAYSDISATADAELRVSAAGVTTPLFSASDLVLAAGGVYTVFVVGPAGSATGFVRRDR